MARHELAQMVLRQQIDGIVVLQHRDIGMPAYGFGQGPFDLGPRQIFVMEDTVFGVPRDQIADQFRRTAHDQFNGRRIAFSGTADQRVVDMFLERVGSIGYRADTALGIIGIALVHFAFRDDRHMAVTGGFECEAQACSTGAYHQKIGLHVEIFD